MPFLLVICQAFWAEFKVGIVLVSAFRVKIRVIFVWIIQLTQSYAPLTLATASHSDVLYRMQTVKCTHKFAKT